MEPLFSAVICGCNAGLLREALHEVYIPRIQRGNAFFTASVLGAREQLLSVLAHFFARGPWGSLVETTVERQSLSAEDQLFIIMQAELCLRATRGMASPEVRICYDRAESLCRSINDPRLLCRILMGQVGCTLITGKMSAALQIAERVYSLAQEQDDPMLVIGASSCLSMTFYNMGDFESGRQYARRAVQIWLSGRAQSHGEGLYTPIVTCLCYQAMSEWALGEITSCRANLAKGISLAKELNDPNALAMGINWAAVVSHADRNIAEVKRLASDLIELSPRHNFVQWVAVGGIWGGWARSASGDTAEGIPWIERGISDYRATGAVLGLPFYLTLKAEALHLADRTSEALEVISEGETLAERFEHRNVFSRLHRLRAVFLCAAGAKEAQIEASFCEAIRIAKDQKSISLEKRAEATYAEYRRQKASASEGRGFRLPL
jgi:hypothetical protein